MGSDSTDPLFLFYELPVFESELAVAALVLVSAVKKRLELIVHNPEHALVTLKKAAPALLDHSELFF